MKQNKLLIKYSIVFLFSSILMYSLNLFYGHSLLYAETNQAGDGLLQHFNALTYYGEWLRSIIYNIFVKHKIEIPMWDLSIGLGGDIITTLSYYVLGDPLNLLAVFVPDMYTEYLYNGLVIFRLYLSGLAFIAYCRYHSLENNGVLAGTLIYVFSFYSIMVSVLHPYFLNPLIYLPLILLGADKILDRKSPTTFILAVFLSAVSNFYFFYMLSIVMAAYIVAICAKKYYGMSISGERHRRADRINIRCIVIDFLRYAVYYLVGLGMSAAVFLPTAVAVLGSKRLNVKVDVPFLYEISYYFKLIIAFVNSSADYYAALGYTIVGMLAVLLLFIKTGRREGAIYKAAFILGSFCLCIPFAGHVMNGFGYVTNRWIWAYCFVISVIVVKMMPQIITLKPIVLFMTSMAAIGFAALTFLYRAIGDGRKLRAAVVVCGMAGFIFVLLNLLAMSIRRKNPNKVKVVNECLVMEIILVNLFLNMFGYYSPYSANNIKNHEEYGTAWKQLRHSPAGIVAKLPDAQEVRFDTAQLGFEKVKSNSAMQYDVNGTAFYYSMTNPSVTQYLYDNEVNIYTDYVYTDMDSRLFLDAALGVKYFVVPYSENLPSCLPWGYNKEVISDGEYSVYTSDNVLPLAYFYDSYYDEEAYQKLPAVYKQQAALQTAAILTDKTDTFAEVEEIELPEMIDFESDYEIACDDGIILEDHAIVVNDPTAAVHIHTESVENCERYFEWKNLWYLGDGIAYISITDFEGGKSLGVAAENSTRYAGVHDIICNLGYKQNSPYDYDIYFSKAGRYTFDKISIINQPVNNIEKQIQELKKVPVDLQIDGNAMIMEISNDDTGIIYASIPYSKGWKAKLDGEEVEVLQVNDFGLGVAVPEGDHELKMEYCTPLFKVGIMIAMMCWGIFCGICTFTKKLY